MKKFNSIKQLKLEKERISNHQVELEQSIKNNWHDIKENLRPVKMAKESLNNIIKSKQVESVSNDSIIKNTLTYGASLLAKKIIDAASDKINKILKK